MWQTITPLVLRVALLRHFDSPSVAVLEFETRKNTDNSKNNFFRFISYQFKYSNQNETIATIQSTSTITINNNNYSSKTESAGTKQHANKRFLVFHLQPAKQPQLITHAQLTHYRTPNTLTHTLSQTHSNIGKPNRLNNRQIVKTAINNNYNNNRCSSSHRI